MEGLPKTSKLKRPLLGLALFLLGAAIGAGGFYFYAIKVMIPKYKAEMVSEMFGEGGAEWGDFFESVEGEEGATNPFEGAGESSGEYVNPFDLIE